MTPTQFTASTLPIDEPCRAHGLLVRLHRSVDGRPRARAAARANNDRSCTALSIGRRPGPGDGNHGYTRARMPAHGKSLGTQRHPHPPPPSQHCLANQTDMWKFRREHMPHILGKSPGWFRDGLVLYCGKDSPTQSISQSSLPCRLGKANRNIVPRKQRERTQSKPPPSTRASRKDGREEGKSSGQTARQPNS